MARETGSAGSCSTAWSSWRATPATTRWCWRRWPSNTAGVALYTRAGFTRVGIYREQGQLDGAWVDVVIMEKLL